MKKFEKLQIIRESLNINQQERFDISLEALIVYAKSDITDKLNTLKTKSTNNLNECCNILPHIRVINEISETVINEITFDENNLDRARSQVIKIVSQVVDRV